MAPRSTRSAPNLRARTGARGAKTPSKVTGTVVRTTNDQPGRPASDVISGSTAEKLEKTVRRFRPISTRQTPR